MLLSVRRRLMAHPDQLLRRQGVEPLRQQTNVHDGILHVVGRYRCGRCSTSFVFSVRCPYT